MFWAREPLSSTITRCMDWAELWPMRKTTSNMDPRPSRGTMTVPMMKPLVFTRVRYSRLIMRRSLRTGRPVNEDFVQRRLEQFETRDLGAGFDGGFQDFLGVSAGLDFGLDATGKARQLADARMPQE